MPERGVSCRDAAAPSSSVTLTEAADAVRSCTGLAPARRSSLRWSSHAEGLCRSTGASWHQHTILQGTSSTQSSSRVIQGGCVITHTARSHLQSHLLR